MDNITLLMNKLKAAAGSSGRGTPAGRQALVKNLFEFLLDREQTLPALLVLCGKDGAVLSLYPREKESVLSGCELDLAQLREDSSSFRFYELIEEYFLITDAGSTDAAPGAKQPCRLADSLTALLSIIDADSSRSSALLSCLDSANHAISIYDRNATLLFANSTFCRDMSITDPQGAVGRAIDEILRDSGIRVYSMEDNRKSLKMMDVLKNGEEAIDWEVRIESERDPGQSRLLSNDMYPVLDRDGSVKGMVELTHSRQQDIRRTRKIMGLAAEYNFDDIIAASPVMKEKIRTAKEYAASPFSFLITGESGVGKELFAQSIHNYSPRRRGPFVALNCANFSDGLIESELFGYVGGAFTGASKNGQIGKFELADSGTLFLDEIGEMPLQFQSKLLRVLENRIVTRIGSTKEIPVNVRIIAATNRNLLEMVEEGLFRQDLYYRLQVLTVEIPPLHQRGEDVLLLADSFLRQAAASSEGSAKSLDPEAQRLLLAYDWPGNVRELRNVINRATVLSKTRTISRQTLEESISSKGYLLKTASLEAPEERLNKRMQEIDSAYVNLLSEALDISGGNKKKAAELIGVSRKTFYRMMEKYKLPQHLPD